MSDIFGELATMPVKQIWDDVRARIVQSELITMAIVELDPGAAVLGHRHVNEQLGFVISGSLTFTVDGERRERGPGETWCIRSDVPHEAVAGPQGAVVAEVYSPVRDDWAALPDSPARRPAWPVDA